MIQLPNLFEKPVREKSKECTDEIEPLCKDIDIDITTDNGRKECYRKLAKDKKSKWSHPDKGGTTENFAKMKECLDPDDPQLPAELPDLIQEFEQTLYDIIKQFDVLKRSDKLTQQHFAMISDQLRLYDIFQKSAARKIYKIIRDYFDNIRPMRIAEYNENRARFLRELQEKVEELKNRKILKFQDEYLRKKVTKILTDTVRAKHRARFLRELQEKN